MATETVTLTAELKDQMSAPLANAAKQVEGFTKAVEDGSKRQAAAAAKQNRLYADTTSVLSQETAKQSRLFKDVDNAMDGVYKDANNRLRKANGQFVTNAELTGSKAGRALAKQFGVEASDTTKAGEKASSNFASGLKKGAALVGAYFGAQMLGGFIAEAARASDATDKFVSTMSFAGLDTSAITKAKDEAKAYADQTVYDLPTIQNMVAQLASNGVKDYMGLTKAAGNLNAVAGGNAETFKSVAMVMTQTAGAGKLTTENWNQMADAIPGAAGPLMKALEQAGAYTGNFRDAMAAGEITSDEFNDALMKLGTDPIAVEAAKSTKTFEGAIGNLQATINSGLMVALDAIKPAATRAISALSDGLGKAMDWTGKAAKGLYDLFVKGDFTGAFAAAFNIEEDNPVVNVLFKIRDGAIGIYDLLTKGDYTGLLHNAFGWEEDSKAVDMLLKLRDAAIEAPAKLKDVVTGLWDMRQPILIVGGLIFTFLIPGMVKAGSEALASAAKQKLAWMMTQTAATRSMIANSAAFWVIIGGWILMGAQATIQAVKIAAGWLIAMGPVGWIILAIAALVGAFVWAYNNIGWFKDGVDAAMRWIGDVVKVVVDWIIGAWNNVVDWFNSTLLPAVQAIGGFFHDAFWVIENYWNTKFLPALQALGQWFVDVFNGIVKIAQDFVGMLVDAWGHIGNWWNSTMVPFLQALAAPFVAAFDWIQRLVWNAMTIIVALWLKLVDLWNGVLLPAIQAVGQWFSDVFTGIWNTVLKPVVDSIVLGFQHLVDFFGTVFAWVYDNIIKPYIDMWVAAFQAVVDWWNLTFIPAMQAFGDWIGSIMTWIYDNAIKPVIDFIVNGFGMIVDFWNLTFIPGLQALGDFIGSVMDWIYNTLIKPVVDGIVQGFQALVDFWNGVLMPAAQAVGDWFSITIGGAINGVKDFINDAVKNFQTFITFVNDKLKPIIDAIKGAFDAVAEAIGKVLGKIGEFANNPLGGIQDWLGIAKDGNGQGVMPTPGNSGGGVYKGNGVAFAGGGVLGGYAPGHDSILARLSPGESVLVPELTKAIGPDNIMAANAQASGGRPAGSGPTLTSGYSAASSGRGGGVTIQAPVTIQVTAGADGSVDTAALRAAVEQAFEDILAEHNRRGY